MILMNCKNVANEGLISSEGFAIRAYNGRRKHLSVTQNFETKFPKK